MITEATDLCSEPELSYSLKQDLTKKDNALFVEVCGHRTAVSLPVLSIDELHKFVKFLNDNAVEPVHIIDCFKDFVYEKLKAIHTVHTNP